MALLRIGGLNSGRKREELLNSYEGEEPYMPGGYETPYDGEEPYMPEGYDDADYGDDYSDAYEDDYGYDDAYRDDYDEGGSRYDDDYGYDEAYGYDEDGYPIEGEDDDGRGPYYDAPEYVPEYPENGLGDLLQYVDDHSWVMWLLLFLVPPLGIWLVWRTHRYSQNAKILMTLLSLIWLTAVLVLLIVRPFRERTDTTITPQPVGAAALPTEAPDESDAQPAEVVTTEEVDDANAVFVVADAPFFHQLENCQAIGDAETSRIARNTAVEKGLLACPYCIAGQYSDGLWDMVFVNADTEDRSNVKVYVSAYNTFFHTNSKCSDLGTDAQKVGLKEALLMSKTACETCCPEAGREVFCTVDGTYYHLTEDCSGMRNASKVPYAEARVLGKKRCPTCIGGTDETELVSEDEDPDVQQAKGYYVYATPNGEYYHVNSTCSGMKNAKQVLLSDMLKQKRPACPVCCPDAETTVFAESGNPYYHSYATCSGMTNATQGILVNALAAGLKRCPVCWTQAS